MVLIFDDDPKFRDFYKDFFLKLEIDLKTLECGTKEEMRKYLKDKDLMKTVKVLVFDLSTTKEEAESLKFDILNDIKENYQKYPIPIFIHSAFAQKVDGYEDVGTLFKVTKDSNSAEKILETIKLFYDSGFLDLFSPGGIIEKELHQQLHSAFINQFVGEEISEIVKSIKHSSPATFKERTKDVFQRIAVRALFQNLISGKKQIESEKVDEIKVNAVEHYFRRKGDYPIWTGDIFRSDTQQVIVLTPRCDISNNYCKGNFLVCRIETLESKKLKEFGKTEDIKGHIEDNPQRTGHKYRYLIPTPAYSGGKIDLTDYFIIDQANLLGETAEFKYLISLSEELTNDIVRKFASYILRGGISASELSEASYYSKAIVNTNS